MTARPDTEVAGSPAGADLPPGLLAHWSTWLGARPEQLAVLGAGPGTLVVVGSDRRTGPAWDGRVAPVAGVADPVGNAVVSLPPEHLAWGRALAGAGGSLDDLRAALPGRLGRPGHVAYRAVLRWSVRPPGADVLPDAGRWLAVTDPAVPEWLHPFGGDALVALDGSGAYQAGVGVKRHDPHGHEISVGTAPEARGRGLARRLVAQAARHLLGAGVVPTYLHDPANQASARVADAAGFPDRGWTALGLADRQEAVEAATGDRP